MNFVKEKIQPEKILGILESHVKKIPEKKISGGFFKKSLTSDIFLKILKKLLGTIKLAPEVLKCSEELFKKHHHKFPDKLVKEYFK